MTLMNLAINHLENAEVLSNPDGSIRRYYTGKRYWGLSLNLRAVNVWLNITSIASGAGVAVWWEYSWDGRSWLRPLNPLVSEKTATGSFSAEHASSPEIAPYGRLVVEVRHQPTPSAQKFATIDLRAHYKAEK